ncbi:hypothetical protein BW723_14505 [Polaribacter reichenbachii]|uniref:Haem-binding uptake Tiki superfamily ChaN domain-containing protein n=1 Tax=Polaribacter reichenbachii TaxID=996801 RepID=A0A1B8U473_9FLAO|nr:hypothetical protein [Polaribacter reichenbachii]APZ47421.1 hypothetical protein BW723_14505 [Polaribacter reichenbachii]AUC18060.1 hypothetical protein BTO17_04950 [Polaribacter reichenbachii]OBY66670.1 hypothetical protein LPB301_05575 [Polaribacter reichenbachii]
MKRITLLLIVSVIFLSCNNIKKPAVSTEIIVMGTQHKAVPNFNSEILFNILEEVKPDLILLELDSIKFTPDFKLKEVMENELIASDKYQAKYPETKLRPFEFEGRNQYRIDNGMRPTDKLTLKLVDSLYNENLLTTTEAEIFKTYKEALEPLKVIAAKSPENWNNSIADSLCEKRQFYQYQMIPKITNTRKEFSSRFLIKPNGEKISYRNGYQLWADFWDLRNQTMAKNIMTISEQNKGKKIVVLCGFMHRYYILKELKRLTKDKNIVLKEFYEK